MIHWSSSLTLCVLLMVGLAAAQPQSRSQQLTPQQQQLLLRQQQQQQQQQKRQQAQQQRPQRPPPGSVDRLPEGQTLASLNDGQLQRFLANEASVKQLTDCFIEPRRCTNRAAISLIKQVRSLGIGGRCKTCSPQEQERLGELIYDFIQGYQTNYADQWRRVLPHLGTLITAVPSN